MLAVSVQPMIGYIVPIVLVMCILIILAMGYVKAPPDRAFIISGLKKEPKILIGRAGIRVPFFERMDKLYLGQMTVDIKTEQSVPTTDFINVNVDAVAKVRIDPTTEGIRLAAKNFLNKTPDQISMDLQDSLQGNMREIIGTLTLKSINTDRDSFSDQVMEKASKDMKKLGIEIVSCNIQNVTDENGLIKDLGADNTAKIKKDASIARAQAERDVAIAQAEANKASNDARVLSETEIAEKNNELAIKKAELQQISDTKKAMADAAYKIQEQEQQKVIQTATVNAQIAKAEREAELRKQEVLVKQQALEAEINKKADADRYAVEQAAAAALAKRQRDAEAKKYEAEQEATAKKYEAEQDALARKAQAEAKKYESEQEALAKKAQAEANKYSMEQEAAGIQARGEAEAEAIRAKGMAEAEAMEKKADAYQKYNRAAVAEMLIDVLPEIAGKIAEPLTQIDKITIIGGGSSDTGVGDVAGNVPAIMTKLFEAMKETVGIDLAEIVKADTYDAKVTRNLNISGVSDVENKIEHIFDEEKEPKDEGN